MEVIPEFSVEFIQAAKTQIGQEAVYHQYFAGNCIQMPSRQCVADGMGPRRFDCSGLIVKLAKDVLALDLTEAGMRHVREMWANAQHQDILQLSAFAVGNLVVFRKRYTIQNNYVEIPGHIGVITEVDATTAAFVHANPKKGRVEEALLTDEWHAEAMGYLAIRQ